ncbi:hypothetical protein LV89_00245 [Arcicella aurantiaca]|uniref:DUF5683 domain-containing protein n=1 Tax=Arcicella aurantiaca TaxID=591202 RepID=A0A316EGG1_9BACT|nr:DUF5683 domain-containing protein [Arcicella aurantiaca]PWK29405.1 hypothetical protein LV89_00245 [Arcicella aurantiaca]
MKKLLFLLLLMTFSAKVFSQKIVVDSSKITVKDTLVKKMSKKDSLKKFYKIIPRVSTIRSAMVPGWGQINNRQYWKLPFIAGAFGVNIFFIIYNDTRYHYYKGYLQQATNQQATASTINVPLYNQDLSRDYNVNQLNTIVSGYRRNRDGSYLLLAVVWAANIVDANVTAHLKTFDMTDDISLKIQPTITSPDMMSPVFGAKLTFAFK